MRNILYKLTLGLVLNTVVFNASAQLNCGSSEMNNKVFAEHPDLLADYNALNNNLSQINPTRSADDTTVYIIPIVFHIIHQNGAENISDAQIIDEVNILNRDYRFGNYSDTVSTILPPFRSLVADCRIEFRLAQLDPNGNCTNGIDRIYSHQTNSASDASKLNPWPRDKYLNVWVVKTIGTAGVAGYAYYPSATSGVLFPADGVLILSDYIGSIGTGSVLTSRALTHEIGHYLNLEHPWGNNNSPGTICGDDLVSDTPPTKGHTACASADLNTPYCTVNPITGNYKFDSLTGSMGTTDTISYDSVVVLGNKFSDFKAVGVGSGTKVNGEFSFDNWDTGAPNAATTFTSLTGTINTSKYYEFTVAPASKAFAMTLTGLSFIVDRNATGPRTWAIRSSANGFASNLTPIISPVDTNLSIQGSVVFIKWDITGPQKGTKVTLSGPAFLNLTTPMTFRLYAYNAEDSLGAFGVDSVYLSGTNGLIENTQNYMDYSYCSKMYTIGQKDRMRLALQSPISHRNNLWTAANLAATGVSSPVVCAPKAEFFSNKNRICAGDQVRFTKNVLTATPDSVRWTFYGGSPFTSVSMAPVNVTYSTPGLYKVTLTAYTAGGTDSITKVDFIRVDPGYADIDYNGFYSEGFEDPSTFYGIWQITNYDNNANAWFRVNTTGYQSSNCVGMLAYGNYQYDVDDLVTPSYDFSFTSGNQMTFRLAAASHAGAGSDANDMLKVYVSKNCGTNWVALATYSDSSLINNGYYAGPFTPTSSSNWWLKTINIPSLYATSNTRFKFEYTTGAASNNVYIDNINITGVVGIDENVNAVSSLSIYPNPSSEAFTIAYHLDKKANTKVEVMDVLGKSVFVQTNSGQAEGDYKVQLSKQNLNLRNGIYFVKFSVQDKAVTKKLIITE